MGNREILLVQDDCAPDAFETFESEFIKITGLKCSKFKVISEKKGFNNGYRTEWILNDYVLSIEAGDPWYVLEKIINN